MYVTQQQRLSEDIDLPFAVGWVATEVILAVDQQSFIQLPDLKCAA
jgi:hypothetical protein